MSYDWVNRYLDTNYPYSSLEYLEKLPAYNANQGVDTLLDLAREIQSSGNYYWSGLVFPNLEMQPTVSALGTISGVIVTSPGTYVTAISGIGQSATTGAEASITDLNQGFNLKLYDKGTKASIFYGDYAQNKTVTGFHTITQDDPSGECRLIAPFIITGPGVIGWEIVNRSTSALRIQVLLDCAVPITNRSIQNTVINQS